MKRFGLLIGMMAAVAVMSGTGAGALEEQRSPVPDAVSPKAQVQDQSGPSKGDGGTEIHIPGLGKLGTLPKMDFGLELLYGAADGKPAQDSAGESQDHDDQQNLMIHGTVKHRF